MSLSHARRVLRRSDYEWRPLATGAGPFARGTPPPGAERANRFNELLSHIGTVRSDGIGRFVKIVDVLWVAFRPRWRTRTARANP